MLVRDFLMYSSSSFVYSTIKKSRSVHELQSHLSNISGSCSPSISEAIFNLFFHGGWPLLIDESIDQSFLDEHIFHSCLPEREITLPIKSIDLQSNCACPLYLLRSWSTWIIGTLDSDTSCYDINYTDTTYQGIIYAEYGYQFSGSQLLILMPQEKDEEKK